MMIFCEELVYEVTCELSPIMVEAYDELGNEAVLVYDEVTMEWEKVS